MHSRYYRFSKISDRELREQSEQVRELIDSLLTLTEQGNKKDQNSGFNSKAKKLAKRLIPETQGGENRASEYRKELRRRTDALPREIQELLKLLDSFEPQRLRRAFETNLWKQENVQIPKDHEFIDELVYIIKVYWSGFFDDMNKFYDSLHDMQIQRDSYNALVNERDTQKCAQIIAGYQNANFTDEARVNLKSSVVKLLDTKEIDRMPPMSQNAVLSFYTTDGRVANFNFTRDMRTLMADDKEKALLWQATQFQVELLSALIQLSLAPEITIGGVELKTDFNRGFINQLDPRVQAIMGGIIDLLDKYK